MYVRPTNEIRMMFYKPTNTQKVTGIMKYSRQYGKNGLQKVDLNLLIGKNIKGFLNSAHVENNNH